MQAIAHSFSWPRDNCSRRGARSKPATNPPDADRGSCGRAARSVSCDSAQGHRQIVARYSSRADTASSARPVPADSVQQAFEQNWGQALEVARRGPRSAANAAGGQLAIPDGQLGVAAFLRSSALRCVRARRKRRATSTKSGSTWNTPQSRKRRRSSLAPEISACEPGSKHTTAQCSSDAGG